jgi:hypothetical protein
MKTYKDSYLYNNKVKAADAADVRKTNSALVEFIKTATRIEAKTDESFRPIMEEIKYQSSGSLLYNIILDPRVKICVGSTELPRAFKVFDAYDKKNNNSPAVFIDCTGLVEFKNGRYFCRRIDTLCAYLFDAMIYLLYRYTPTKIVSNSTLIANAAECYVSMFSYIIDYLRVVGYSVNKNKVDYLVGLFFLNNMCGLDIEASKPLAAKIANVSPSDIPAYSMFIEDGMFDNLNTFISKITTIFNLKGFTIEIFIQRWIYLFGTGTQYATELLTSFLVVAINACTGTYIVNQKNILRCCGKNNSSPIVKLYVALKKVGIDTFDVRGFVGESMGIDKIMNEKHRRGSIELADSMKLRKNLTIHDIMVESSEMHSVEEAVNKCNNIKKTLENARLNNELNDSAFESINNTIYAAVTEAISIAEGKTNDVYGAGVLTEVAKAFKGILNANDKSKLSSISRDSIRKIKEAADKSDVENIDISVVNNIIKEIRDVNLNL